MLRPVLSLSLRGALTFALLACGSAPAEGTGTGEGSSTTGGTSLPSGTAATEDSTGTTDGGSTGAPLPPLGPWRVMSFNIMCSGCRPEGFSDWDVRVPWIGDTMRRHDPDLLGVQELFSADEVAQIEAELQGAYTSIWFKKPDPMSLDYADAAIFYRSERFEELEHGFYWLSPHPDTPYSTGFDPPQLPRLVVWARLRALAEDAEFVFATTHFDNNSPSQELSAPLVLDRTASLAASLPVILVGDFNSQPADQAYAILTGGVMGAGPHLDDTFALAGAWRGDSNLDPPPVWDPAQRIDHIFVAGAPWQASDWVVDLWGYGPTMHATSDHYAIAALLSTR